MLPLEGVHLKAAGEVEAQETLALVLELRDALVGSGLRRAEAGETAIDLLGDEPSDLGLELVRDEDSEVVGLDQPLQLVGRHVGLLACGSAKVAAEAEEVAVLLALDLHVGPTRGAGRAEELSAEVVVVAPLADDSALVLSDHRLDRVEELGLDDRLVVALVLVAVPAHDAGVELVGEEAMHLRDGGDGACRRSEPVVGHEVADLADRQLPAAEDLKCLTN